MKKPRPAYMNPLPTVKETTMKTPITHTPILTLEALEELDEHTIWVCEVCSSTNAVGDHKCTTCGVKAHEEFHVNMFTYGWH